MKLIAQKCFPETIKVTDRFNAQELAFEALQEITIDNRCELIDRENQSILQDKTENILPNF